jgi:hypothetical protein
MHLSPGASRTCQDKIGRWQCPGIETKIKCHDKLSKWQIVCFLAGNET